jgi:hypothetical protein
MSGAEDFLSKMPMPNTNINSVNQIDTPKLGQSTQDELMNSTAGPSQMNHQEYFNKFSTQD